MGEYDVWPGRPYPLGATYDGVGTNFSLFSEVAERVELCLFDEQGHETRVDLPEVTGFVWHGYMTHIGPGRRYGYRVHGPYAPDQGHRCNPHKLLLDPYAKTVEGRVDWHPSVYGYADGDPHGAMSTLDSADHVPKGVVVDPWFDWGDDRRPAIPLHKSIIYETHVKGLTVTHPGVPEALRGTYGGIGHPVMVDYLTRLGVTAVELLPIHHAINEAQLVARGLTNYWGYNTLGYFAPDPAYTAARRRGGVVGEFKRMVKELHAAGIEVILDVVYNHTAETDHTGPTLSMRGIDNAHYYRISDADPRYYVDYTGCGNSLDARNPHVLQLIMDSLRYWATEMHVDGFRFDLAAALARELHDVDRLSTFFEVIQQDPVISQVKLIAEPWDLGEGGYQVGNFPPQWSEWNGHYRDTIRDYWRGVDKTLPVLASRLTGSSDLYASSTRYPSASINFVTSHDGFTLADLVAYDQKHNDANGYHNTDGTDDNRSWNCGVEGPSDDDDVLALRARQQRNFLATLLLSQGVPMLLGGDEFGRSQRGNNNAYCQDNELSWYDWDDVDDDLLAYTKWLIALRTAHPVFRRRGWFEGRPLHGEGIEDIVWCKPDGTTMSEGDWGRGSAKAMQVFLSGDGLRMPDVRGERLVDDHFLTLFNAHSSPTEFVAPAEPDLAWQVILDTRDVLPRPMLPARRPERVRAGARRTAVAHSFVLLRAENG
jgi:glycogen operon protein